jgi:hypothetical protein
MVAKSEDHKSVQVPGLILTNNTEVRRFVRGLTRHEMRSNYKKEFNNIDFSSKELLDKLKNYRVKMEV